MSPKVELERRPENSPESCQRSDEKQFCLQPRRVKIEFQAMEWLRHDVIRSLTIGLIVSAAQIIEPKMRNWTIGFTGGPKWDLLLNFHK